MRIASFYNAPTTQINPKSKLDETSKRAVEQLDSIDLSRPELDSVDQIPPQQPQDREQVIAGSKRDEPKLSSLAQARRLAQELTFLPIDPFVASVGASISAERIEIPKGEVKLQINSSSYYSKAVNLMLGKHNGEEAPLLVILPGIHSDGTSPQCNLLRKIALERGMNYLVIPNSLSQEMLKSDPLYHPGNPRVDAFSTRELLSNLKVEHPELFKHGVSIAGYSYGALHGANLVRLDEEGDERIIDGSLVALSPPENLEHSMQELDGLRRYYQSGADPISATVVKYRSEVKKYGYDNFLASELALRGEGSNVTEIKIADKYGSRDSLKELVEVVDTQFHHNLLPKNTQAYKDANLKERYRLGKEHADIVENITYSQFSDRYMANDKWLNERGLTPEEMAKRYSFSNAINAIDDTPILTLVSADDYILNPADVKAFQALESSAGPLEIVQVIDRGGHVGLDWNPKVEELMGKFVSTSPAAKTKNNLD